LRGQVSPKFSVPYSGKTIHQTPKVLELQEHARGPMASVIFRQFSSPFLSRQFDYPTVEEICEI